AGGAAGARRPAGGGRGMTMTHPEALSGLARPPRGRGVVATMTSGGGWAAPSAPGRVFVFLPPPRGAAPARGLARAPAQPARGVVVLNGDGCTRMSLGCLVTLAAEKANVFLLIMDNGLYEVTGGQPVAGAGRTDFAGLARAAGIGRVYAFGTLAAWE